MMLTMLGPEAATRPLEQLEEIHRQLWLSHAESALIQAINRIALRRIIDEDGNVQENTNVYVLLPKNEDGRKLTETLETNLPDIQCNADWGFAYKKVPTETENGRYTRQYQKDIIKW